MKFRLFNLTDGILASPKIFDTQDEAEAAKRKWRLDRLGRPYLTGDHRRIEAHQVVLEIEPIQ